MDEKNEISVALESYQRGRENRAFHENPEEIKNIIQKFTRKWVARVLATGAYEDPATLFEDFRFHRTTEEFKKFWQENLPENEVAEIQRQAELEFRKAIRAFLGALTSDVKKWKSSGEIPPEFSSAESAPQLAHSSSDQSPSKPELPKASAA